MTTSKGPLQFFGMSSGFTRFRTHRLGGLAFLVTYAAAWALYYNDYEAFERTKIAVVPAAVGLFQAVSAALTFTFLPRNENSGYFSNKGVLSRAFVLENGFYQLMTCFGAVWYTLGNDVLNKTALGQLVVLVFTFLPYTLLRPLFPTTRLSTTQTSKPQYRSEGYVRFYSTGTELIRLFYLWGKHFMGFGFNYLVFLDLVNRDDIRRWGAPLLLLNIGTVSLAVFLHTLRFKKILRPEISFTVYVAMAYASFLAVPPLCLKLYETPLVAYLVLQGLIVNLVTAWRRGRGWRAVMHAHYVFAMYMVCTARQEAQLQLAS